MSATIRCALAWQLPIAREALINCLAVIPAKAGIQKNHILPAQINNPLAMNRRTHLRSLVALGICFYGWVANPVAARTAQGKKADTESLKRVLAKLFADRDGACAIGYSYLALFPETAHGALERARTLLAPHAHGTTALAEALTRRRQEEFARSETVILGGWVLARCEADMCAALALLITE